MTPLKDSSELRFALFGAGFWAQYQLAAWREIPNVRCVAILDPVRSKAEALARRFEVPAVFNDPCELVERTSPHFIDIVSDADSHVPLVEFAASHRMPVICQKPLAPTWRDADALVDKCRAAGIPLLVHENWRWQTQIRALAAALASAPLGRTWRAHINYGSSFPCFTFQPALRSMPRFILMDMGTHIFDTMRYLFGEAESVYAQGHRVAADIQGEDAVSALFRLRNGMTAYVNLSYASRIPGERFPETFITVEGEGASVTLGADCVVQTVTAKGTQTTRHPPPSYHWADPRFSLVHASIVATHRHLASALRGEVAAETTGQDNLNTLRLVFGCCHSIDRGEVVRF